MKIGILSDSHDNLPKIELAVRFFNKEKVDFVFHAGDFVAPFTIPKLDSLSCGWAGVFGNNDGEKKGLLSISEGKIKGGPLRTELGNKKIILVHDIKTLSLERELAQLIIFGHTHKPEIIKESDRLMVNPGEAGGWLTGEPTVAIVDLGSLLAKIHNIGTV